MEYRRLSSERPPAPIHDEYEQDDDRFGRETTPLSSTISRPSSSIALDGLPVRHTRRDDWSFWLLGAVILLSWNGQSSSFQSYDHGIGSLIDTLLPTG
jgi:hypothetical protein